MTGGIVRTDTFVEPDALLGMAPFFEKYDAKRASAHDPVRHAVREFTGGVAIMMESSVGDEQRWERLAEGVFAALHKASPPKAHPLIHALLGGTVTLFLTFAGLAYNAGMMANRVSQAELEIRGQALRLAEVEHKIQGIDVVSAKLDVMERDLERLLDTRKQR